MRALANDQRINGVSYGWEGARNASPSVQRVNGAVVRRNLAINSRPTSGWFTIAGTGGTANISYSQLGGADGTREYVRSTWTKSSTQAYRGLHSPPTSAVALGAISISAYVRPSLTQRMRIEVVGPTFVQNGGPTLTCPAGEWTRLWFISNVTVAAASTDIRLYAAADGHAWQTGEYLDASALLVEQRATMESFFDGDSVVTSETINRIAL